MTTRPKNPPLWATDTNFPAGGDSWSGTPTKVAPTGGMIQTGHVPEQGPSAQIENYFRNELGQWLTFFQDMQVLNWPMHTVIGGIVANGNQALALGHTTSPSMILLGGAPAGPNFKFSLNGGQSWVNASRTNDNVNIAVNCCAVSGATCIASGPSLGAGVGSQNIYRSTDGGQNWVGNIALPTSSAGVGFSINHVHRAASVFVAGGNDHAGVQYLATSSDGASGNWTQRTLTGGTGSRTVLKIVSGLASGAPRIVALGVSDFSGTPVSIGWYSDDGGVTWSAMGSPPTNLAVAAAYSADTGIWMMLGRSGNNATVHTSPDGITWGPSLATLQDAGCATTPVTAGGNQLTVNGSMWVSAAPIPQSGFASKIYWSTDSGTTWRVARIGSTSMAIRSVLYAPQTQVGFHGGISAGEAAVSGSDWDTNYRQSLRLGLPASL
jgi:hypothetical protein